MTQISPNSIRHHHYIIKNDIESIDDIILQAQIRQLFFQHLFKYVKFTIDFPNVKW